MRVVALILFAMLFFGCGSDGGGPADTTVTQQDIMENLSIEKLRDEPFYLTVNLKDGNTTYYQQLKRFDMIFVGHDTSDNPYTLDVSSAIPGEYTHILTYLGKDSEGFAYAFEMNTDANQSFAFTPSGAAVGGKLYVYCIGSDFGERACPVDDHIYGLETYDYMLAKRLSPSLYAALMAHETQLVETIKSDARRSLPFQLPFRLDALTLLSKQIVLVDDGRENGADCTAYIMSLFEEIAGVCPSNVRIHAAELTDYYVNDPYGRLAWIPEDYNVFSEGDLYLHDLLTQEGFSIADNTARQSECDDGRILQGIPTPQKVFESSDLVDITLMTSRI